MSRTALVNKNHITGLKQDQRKIVNTYRLTSNQKMVYETLLNLGRSAGAYELLDLLRKKGVNPYFIWFNAFFCLLNLD